MCLADYWWSSRAVWIETRSPELAEESWRRKIWWKHEWYYAIINRWPKERNEWNEDGGGNGRIDFGTLESTRDGLELAHEIPRMLITVECVRAFMGEKSGFFCGEAEICHGQDFHSVNLR